MHLLVEVCEVGEYLSVHVCGGWASDSQITRDGIKLDEERGLKGGRGGGRREKRERMAKREWRRRGGRRERGGREDCGRRWRRKESGKEKGGNKWRERRTCVKFACIVHLYSNVILAL